MVRQAIAICVIVNILRVFTLVGKMSVIPTIAVFHFFDLGPSFQKKSVLKNDLTMLPRMSTISKTNEKMVKIIRRGSTIRRWKAYIEFVLTPYINTLKF